MASAAFMQGPSSAANSKSDVFTPAHSSISQPARHFFGLRSQPQQPIAFVHKVHVEQVQMTCVDCHITVGRGAIASIPDIRTCWSCHEQTLVEHPEVMKIKAYHDAGKDIPWQ